LILNNMVVIGLNKQLKVGIVQFKKRGF